MPEHEAKLGPEPKTNGGELRFTGLTRKRTIKDRYMTWFESNGVVIETPVDERWFQLNTSGIFQKDIRFSCGKKKNEKKKSRQPF